MNANIKNKQIIQCIDLQKKYLDTTTQVHALRGINLKIQEGEFIAIIGSSGSGKTTLLNLIGGLDKPTEGKIFFNGEDISVYPEEKRTLYRRNIGFIFQDFNLHPVLTVSQNIELPMIYAEKLPKKQRLERIEKLLELVELRDRVNHLPVELSSGEKQRVGIARALANEPKLILADQPTGNLDSILGKNIIDLMIQLRKKLNLTIILVTHNLEVAKKADRILGIKDGVIDKELSIC